MAYYDALIAKWATLTGTTEERLAEVNAATTQGPRLDTPKGDAMGVLALRGKLIPLQDFAASGGSTNAVMAARTVMLLLTTPAVTVFETSDPAKFQAIEGMLDLIASDAASGLVADDVAALIALSDGPPVPWGAANGYPAGGINTNDLTAAGLI